MEESSKSQVKKPLILRPVRSALASQTLSKSKEEPKKLSASLMKILNDASSNNNNNQTTQSNQTSKPIPNFR